MIAAILLALGVLTQTAQSAGPSAAPASAPEALKATIRFGTARIDIPAGTPTNPLGDFGALLANLITPEGAVQMEYVISGDSMRAVIHGRLATLPRDTIILQRAGESGMRVLDPASKTWYELPPSQNLGALLGTPDVEVQPTGETTMIAGQRAQRFRVTETMQMPSDPGVALPPEFPHEIQFTGDLWSTDAFSGGAYAAIFRTLQAFAAVPGMEALMAGGRFPLRLYLRSPFIAGYEIRSEVTAIAPSTADPSLFRIPDGYLRIQPPVGGLPE